MEVGPAFGDHLCDQFCHFQTVTPKILGQATTEIFNGVLLGYRQMKAGQHLTSLPIDFDAIKHILLIRRKLLCDRSCFEFCPTADHGQYFPKDRLPFA